MNPAGFSQHTVSISHLDQALSNWIQEISSPSILFRIVNIYPEKSIFPEEELCIINAIPARRAEFAAGRYCGRQLLKEMGLLPSPILVGILGEPLWPKSIIGSISHDDGIAIAVISSNPVASRLGIDVVRLGHRPGGISAELIASRSELESVEKMIKQSDFGQIESCQAIALLLTFSAKESVIKSLSPGLDYHIDFREIFIKCQDRSIQAYCQEMNKKLEIHWCIIFGMIFTFTYSNSPVLPKYAPGSSTYPGALANVSNTIRNLK